MNKLSPGKIEDLFIVLGEIVSATDTPYQEKVEMIRNYAATSGQSEDKTNLDEFLSWFDIPTE